MLNALTWMSRELQKYVKRFRPSDGRWSTKPRRVINPIVTLSLEEISGLESQKLTFKGESTLTHPHTSPAVDQERQEVQRANPK